jgi:hypothetical protein
MPRRALLSALSIALLAAPCACEPRVAGLAIEDASFSRQPDGTWLADVDVRAVEATGRDIGRHCVAAFWFSPGADLASLRKDASYGGAYESGAVCFDGGMEDGDERRVRLVTKRADIPFLSRVRVQGVVGSDIAYEDFTTP